MRRDERSGVAKYYPAVALTVAALFLWGLGHELYGSLLPQLQAALQLSRRQTGMAAFAVAFGYFAMALPTAFISRNFGCKLGVLIGLGTIAMGMFLFRPAVEQHSYAYALVGAGVIGSGLVIIQITTAPLLLFLGPLDSAIRRMNIAHAFTPLGELGGLWLGQQIASNALGKSASVIGQNLMLPLSAIGIVAIALAFALELMRFPAGAVTRSSRGQSTWASFGPPLRHARFRFGVWAALFSLVAQVILGGISARFCQSAMPDWSPALVEQWATISLVAFVSGRFVGAGLMFRIDPPVLLIVFSAASALFSAVAIVAPGAVAIGALILACFFLSIQLPTIVGYAIRDLGDAAKSAVALLMFVAIAGTTVTGLAIFATTPSARAIMILPTLCFAASTLCALAMRRAEAAERNSPPRTDLSCAA